MEFVNLYGCTTAEKLIKLSEAVNDLHSIVNELGLFVYDGTYDWSNPNYQYNTELLHTPTITDEVLNRPVYFSENTVIAIITTYGNNLFTVRNARNITGAQGAQGERGERGEKGERGEQGVQGEKGDTGAQGAKGLTGTGVANITHGNPYISGDYTVTPVNYEMSDGTDIESSVYAKNGSSAGIIVDDQLNLTSLNPVQNKVVTAAINAAANTPKLFLHGIYIDLVIGTTLYHSIRLSIIDTEETSYTFDTFLSKYNNKDVFFPAFYEGRITHPGTNRPLALLGIEFKDGRFKISGIQSENSSGQYNIVEVVYFYNPPNTDYFDDFVTEV